MKISVTVKNKQETQLSLTNLDHHTWYHSIR